MGEVKDTKAIQQALLGSMEATMRVVTEDLLGRAQRQVPRDEGTLEASGTAEVHREGDTVVGRVTFGTPYARVQHEELDFEHPKGGNAKYLEGPLKETAPRYQAALAAAARKALDG